MTCEPHDMQSGARPVGTVDQTAIVQLDVVGLNHFRTGGSDLGNAGRMAYSIRAESHRVLVGRRNEIGHLLYGKGIANIPNPRARVKPGENGKFSVVERIKRFSGGMCPEPPALPAEISRCLRHAEGRKGPGCGFDSDVQQEAQVRRWTVSIRTRRAVLPSR